MVESFLPLAFSCGNRHREVSTIDPENPPQTANPNSVRSPQCSGLVQRFSLAGSLRCCFCCYFYLHKNRCVFVSPLLVLKRISSLLDRLLFFPRGLKQLEGYTFQNGFLSDKTETTCPRRNEFSPFGVSNLVHIVKVLRSTLYFQVRQGQVRLVCVCVLPFRCFRFCVGVNVCVLHWWVAKRKPIPKHIVSTSPELAPLFPFLLFWGSLCFPLTRQKKKKNMLGSLFSSLEYLPSAVLTLSGF